MVCDCGISRSYFFLQRLKYFRILCVIIYLDSGVHDYVLTKTESGAKIWSVIYIYPTYWLKLLSILKRGKWCCLFNVVYAFVFDPAF